MARCRVSGVHLAVCRDQANRGVRAPAGHCEETTCVCVHRVHPSPNSAAVGPAIDGSEGGQAPRRTHGSAGAHPWQVTQRPLSPWPLAVGTATDCSTFARLAPNVYLSESTGVPDELLAAAVTHWRLNPQYSRFCPDCKLPPDRQRFGDRQAQLYVDQVERHTGCGHVMAYRSGGLDSSRGLRARGEAPRWSP